MKKYNIKRKVKNKITNLSIIVICLFFCACGNIKNNTYNSIDKMDVDKLYEEIENAITLKEYPRNESINNIDVVKFGRYEQDGNKDNGLEEIEWIVLKKEGSKALLFSKSIIELLQFDKVYDDNGNIIEEKKECDSRVYTSYKNSLVRKWLNEDFLDIAFSNSQIESILSTELDYNMFYQREIDYSGTLAYFDNKSNTFVSDKVFLINVEDIKKYITREFVDFEIETHGGDKNFKLMSFPTQYVQNKFIENYQNEYIKNTNLDVDDYEINDYIMKNDEDITSLYICDTNTYMLRDNGNMADGSNMVKCIDKNGYVPKYGKLYEEKYSSDEKENHIISGPSKYNSADVKSFLCGVRPAMWINLENKEFTKKNKYNENKIGNGTSAKYSIHDILKAHDISEYRSDVNIDDFDTIVFGKYEQDANFTNGLEDIEWIVINKTNDSVNLMSKYVLDYGYEQKFSLEKSFNSNELKVLSDKLDYVSIRDLMYCDDLITDETNTFLFTSNKFKTDYTEYSKYLKKFYDEEYTYDGYWLIKKMGKPNISVGGNFSGSSNYGIRIDDNGQVNEYGEIYKSEADYSSQEWENEICLKTSGYRFKISISLSELNEYTDNNENEIEYHDYEYEKKYDYNNIEKVRPMLSSRIKRPFSYYFLTDFKPLNSEFYDEGSTVDMLDTIKYGKYEQDADENNGPEDIEWIIIEMDEDNRKALLMSKNILDYMKYKNIEGEEIYSVNYDKTFNNSDVKEFLNDEFYNKAFSNEEKENILESKIKYKDENQIESVTNIKMFLPEKLYGIENNNITAYNDYVLNKYLEENDRNSKYSKKEITSYFLIDNYYTIANYSQSKYYKNSSNGIRPMMWIKY